MGGYLRLLVCEGVKITLSVKSDYVERDEKIAVKGRAFPPLQETCFTARSICKA
jgi:hypothetical protein